MKLTSKMGQESFGWRTQAKYPCGQTDWYLWCVLSPFVGNKLEAPKKPAQINLSQETNQEARIAAGPETIRQWEIFERLFRGDQVVWFFSFYRDHLGYSEESCLEGDKKWKKWNQMGCHNSTLGTVSKCIIIFTITVIFINHEQLPPENLQIVPSVLCA